MRNVPRRWMTLALAGVLAASFTATACSSDDDKDEGDKTPAATAASTPAGSKTSVAIDISGVSELEDGKLTLGSDIAYAPIEFLDEDTNEPVGLDIDLANAMGEVLGVEVVFENGSFDGLLAALDTDRYDAIMSAMSVNPERKQQVDFVEYFNAGSGIIVPKGNPKDVADADGLCGMKVAVQEGTVQVDFLTALDQKCKDASKDGVEVLKFGSDPEAVQALIAGQADAEIADYPVSAYSAKQSDGKLEVISNQIEPGPYGIAVRKDSTDLNDVLTQAFAAIKANGEYTRILQEWGLQDGKLD